MLAIASAARTMGDDDLPEPVVVLFISSVVMGLMRWHVAPAAFAISTDGKGSPGSLRGRRGRWIGHRGQSTMNSTSLALLFRALLREIIPASIHPALISPAGARQLADIRQFR